MPSYQSQETRVIILLSLSRLSVLQSCPCLPRCLTKRKGEKTTDSGAERRFRKPPLAP